MTSDTLTRTINAILEDDGLSGPLQPIEKARGLPAKAYVDEKMYELEAEKLLKPEWIPLLHITSIPNPGDYRVIEILGKPLLVVRDKTGKVNVFLNACKHRGMPLSEENGHCTTFFCPYHMWNYDLEGNLIGAPLLNDWLAKNPTKLTQYNSDVLLGFVFVNLSGTAAPIREVYGEIEDDLAAWVKEDLHELIEKRFACDFNWKLMYENAVEGYHVLGTHRNSMSGWPPHLTYSSALPDRSGAITHMPFTANGHDDMVSPSGVPSIEGLPAWEQEQLRFYFMFPGFLVWASPHGLIANMAQPGRTVNEMVFTWHLLVPKAMLGHEAIEAFREEQAGFMDLIQSEDQSCLAPIHRTFQVIGPEEWTSGPYAKAEGAVLDFHQWYLTRLGAGC
jgi:phenylpropionate dioxygenase-like ring-hydroxylating dioxygenase large terminal subunit